MEVNTKHSTYRNFLNTGSGSDSKQISGTLAIQFANMIFTLLASLLLARMLMANGLGIYKYAMSWVDLLVILSLFGFDVLLVREIAVFKANKRWEEIRELFNKSRTTIIVISFIIVLISSIIAALLTKVNDKLPIFLFSFLLIPLITQTRVIIATMQGLQHVVLSQFPRFFFKPLIILITIIILYLSHFNLTPLHVILIHIAVTAVTLLISFLLLKSKSKFNRSVKTMSYDHKYWVLKAWPFFIISIMYIVNSRTDILMLGSIKTASDVGIYGIVNRGAYLILFVLMAVNKVFSPQFAALYAQKKMKTLQKLFIKSTYITIFGSLPIVFTLIFFGKEILFFFGAEFPRGYAALVILIIGQFVAVLLGPQGRLFVMSGYEKLSSKIIGSGAVINIILNSILIPAYGIEGAAIATTLSTIYIKIFLSYKIYEIIDIAPSFISFLFSKMNLSDENF